jgi:drug/metabolite transporter (DMT)-like permease
VTVLQFTFIRGLVSLILGLLWSSGKLKKELVDCIDRSNFPSLAFRCLQGALSVYISFMCVKYFDVSTVGVVCSLTPLFVCILAYFILGERMSRFEQLSILFIVAAVSLVMLGGDSNVDTSQKEEVGMLPLIALLSQPVLLASGIITMRKMRRLPETCASTYCNLSLFLLSFGVMVA